MPKHIVVKTTEFIIQEEGTHCSESCPGNHSEIRWCTIFDSPVRSSKDLSGTEVNIRCMDCITLVRDGQIESENDTFEIATKGS